MGMKLDPKILIVAGVAAVAWYVLRKKPDAAAKAPGGGTVQATTTTGGGSIWDGLGLGTGNTAAGALQAPPVSAPAPVIAAPAPPMAVWGGSSGAAPVKKALPTVSASGYMTYPDGSGEQLTKDALYVHNLQKNGWNGLPY